MSKKTIEALREGALRPNRVYDGGFRVSACGRMLEGGDGVVLATPHGVLLTTSGEAARVLEQMDLVFLRLESFSKTKVLEMIDEVASIKSKRALRWVVGK